MPADPGLAKTHFLENCDLRTLLEPAPAHAVQAASKIVCTLGPACRDVETLVQLLNAGMTAARVDLTVCMCQHCARASSAGIVPTRSPDSVTVWHAARGFVTSRVANCRASHWSGFTAAARPDGPLTIAVRKPDEKPRNAD